MKLYLNSVDSSNNKYKLDDAIEGEWKLISFAFTNNIYNVNDTNNKIYFTEETEHDENDYTATLTNGINDPNDLKSNIETAMNNETNETITVTYDDKTKKFTITSTETFYFKFGTNKSNSANKLIGMNAIHRNGATSHTSDTSIDLNPYKEIFINIEENNDRNVFGVEYFNSSLIVCECGSSGDIVRYNYRDNSEQRVKLKRTKDITIRIHDSKNQEINLNSEYSIVLEKN